MLFYRAYFKLSDGSVSLKNKLGPPFWGVPTFMALNVVSVDSKRVYNETAVVGESHNGGYGVCRIWEDDTPNDKVSVFWCGKQGKCVESLSFFDLSYRFYGGIIYLYFK